MFSFLEMWRLGTHGHGRMFTTFPLLKALKTPLLASLQGFSNVFTFVMTPLRLVKRLR